MSGSTAERQGEPTLADHVTRIRNIHFQLGQWSAYPDIADQLRTDLATYRETFPDAADAYDAEVLAEAARWENLRQRTGEVAVNR